MHATHKTHFSLLTIMTTFDHYLNSHAVQRELSKIFTCSICLGLINKPKTLPRCGHTFCYVCIKTLAETETPAAYATTVNLSCPECRTINAILTIDALPENRSLQSVIDLVRHSNNHARSEDEPDVCHNLLMTEPIICQHCQRDFCKSCIVHHFDTLKVHCTWLCALMSRRLSKLHEESLAMRISRTNNKTCKKKPRLTLTKAAIQYAQNVSLAQTEFGKVNQSVQRFKTFLPSLIEPEQAFELWRQIVDFDAHICSLESGECQFVNEHLKSVQFPSDLRRLHNAACQGDVAVLRDLLSQCSHDDWLVFIVESRDPQLHNDTLLLQATRNGHCDAVKLLLSKHAKITVHSNDDAHSSILHLAAQSGNCDLVRIFMRLAPNLMVERDRHKFTPLERAINLAHKQVALCFVHEFGAKIDNSNVLFMAIDQNDVDMVSLILDLNPHWLEVKDDDDSDTPLLRAVKANSVDVVEYLMARDQQPNLTARSMDSLNSTALHLVAEKGNLRMLKVLLPTKSSLAEIRDSNFGTPLCRAVAAGHLEIVQFLVNSQNAKLDVVAVCNQSPHHRLPIHIAAANGHLEIFKFMLKKRRNLVDMPSSAGLAPLSFAVLFNQLAVVRYLLTAKRNQVDLERRSVNNLTPLHQAVVFGQSAAMIFELINFGADIHAATSYQLSDKKSVVTFLNLKPANAQIADYIETLKKLMLPKKAGKILMHAKK